MSIHEPRRQKPRRLGLCPRHPLIHVLADAEEPSAGCVFPELNQLADRGFDSLVAHTSVDGDSASLR